MPSKITISARGKHMALKDILKMTKVDRYTQDGRDELAKLQETEDVKYKTGDISQKTGLQKQPDGSWAPPKSNGVIAQQKQKMESEKYEAARRDAQAPSKKTEVNTPGLRKDVQEAIKRSSPEEIKSYIKELRTPGSRMSRYFDNPDLLANVYEDELNKTTESKPAESPKSDNKIMNYEEAEKAIDEGKVVQWEHRDGKWHDIDPKTSALVQARDIGAKFRIKTDEDGNPIAQKPEPSQNELRSKLIELEKRRKKFEKYPDMDNNIRLQQGALLNRAGFESRAEFDDFIKSEMPTDSAPRELTGDCKIHVRKA